MKNTQLTFKIVFTAILCAVIAVLTFTFLGMIPLSVVAITTIFLPLAIGITIIDDLRCTLVLGVCFGLCSLLKAISASSPIDILFIYPHISILPRVLCALVSHLLYRLIYKFIRKENRNAIILKGAICGGLVALFNTIFTIGAILLFYFDTVNIVKGESTIWYFLFAVIGINALCELFFGILVSSAICKGIHAAIIVSDDEE